MIYNSNAAEDYKNILQYINEYTKGFGAQNVQVDPTRLTQVCLNIRSQFPHVDGIDNASAFKKVANFVAHFIHLKPIKSSISALGGAGHSDINAVVAFDIAILCLQHSHIRQKSGALTAINRGIYISDHSYHDIIEALSAPNICPTQHYQILAVLFEQIVYKTNPQCQYSPEPSTLGYYIKPHSVTESDDMSSA